MDSTTTGSAADSAALASKRADRLAKASRKLHDLLDSREELRGVYAPADHLAETLRWSA